MATPRQSEWLNTEELVALREALNHPVLSSALAKIFAFDARFHTESMENESLTATPNTNLIIQYAARSRNAREFMNTIKNRMDQLTQKQR